VSYADGAPGNTSGVELMTKLPPEPVSASVARQFVRGGLARSRFGNIVDEATAVADELVTNGILHGRTELQLTVTEMGRRLRVEVLDGNTRIPVQSHVGVDATSGRGLDIVAAISRSWGCDERNGGKVVWCELTRRRA